MTGLNINLVHIELLRDSEGQYFNIPPELEFLTDNVLVQRRGNQLILSPVLEESNPNRPDSAR